MNSTKVEKKIYAKQRINIRHIGPLSLSLNQQQLNIQYWLTLIFTQIYSMFHQEVSYHFIVERDYCKLNFAYQI